MIDCPNGKTSNRRKIQYKYPNIIVPMVKHPTVEKYQYLLVDLSTNCLITITLLFANLQILERCVTVFHIKLTLIENNP